MNKRTHSSGNRHFLFAPSVFINRIPVAKRIAMFSNDVEMFVDVNFLISEGVNLM